MSHSIEHVHDPEAWLVECRRVLKPGGRLVVVTPNSASLGSRWFAENWRGLEPPRHLQIFTAGTLSRVTTRAGLRVSRAFTISRAAYGIFLGSAARNERDDVSRNPSRARSLTARLFQALEASLMILDPMLGEEVVLLATK
jgi:SAM-dependent methyltransferase